MRHAPSCTSIRRSMYARARGDSIRASVRRASGCRSNPNPDPKPNPNPNPNPNPDPNPNPNPNPNPSPSPSPSPNPDQAARLEIEVADAKGLRIEAKKAEAALRRQVS